MIRKLEFHNFKALRDVSVDLEPLTVFVGPNASGKTSILEGINDLLIAATEGADHVFSSHHSPKYLKSWDAVGVGALRLECRLHQGLMCLSAGHYLPVGDGPTEGVSKQVHHVTLGEWSGTVERVLWDNFNPADLGPGILLRFDVTKLVAPSYSQEAHPRLAPDGDGLPSVLAYMLSNLPDVFDATLESLRQVIPIVRGMRFPRAAVSRIESEVITVDGKPFTYRGERQYWGHSIEFDFVGARGVPAHMVSEGTVLVLGILTAIVGPDRPNVVLLDDLDRGLHPRAQADLVGLLRKLMEQNPKLQIVATSHSPYLLDCLRPEEVRLTTLKDDGSVACARLDQHPEFEKWKDEMAPGEFWSMVGESWVAQVASAETKQ